MALSDNKRLFDISTRLAFYVEGVKVYQARQFNAVLLEVRETLEKLLGRVKYRTLDGLSKAQLNKLIIELRKSQSKIYSKYTQDLIDQLKEFMKADLEVNRRMYASAEFQFEENDSNKVLSDEESKDFVLFFFGALALTRITPQPDNVWTNIANSPIPANGMNLQPFIKAFSTSAQAGVENTIRKAWANKLTVAETLKELIGDPAVKQGNSGQLNRVRNQAANVINTAVAHVAAIASNVIQSALYSRYAWYSVIDDGTTNVCRRRNLNVYRYGQGPLPPAHYGCRSHTAPIVGSEEVTNETKFSWLRRQPNSIQDDILGSSGADLLRSGNLTAADLDRYEASRPLKLEQFKRLLDQILQS